MAQDTYDIEEDINSVDAREATEHLFTPATQVADSRGYEGVKFRDNIVDVAEANGIDPIAAKMQVEGIYRNTPNASTALTQDRIHFTRQGFEEAERQLFATINTVQEPSFVYQTLERQKAKLDSVINLPYAHEASIELVSKGMIENAPTEYAAGEVAGMNEDSGLLSTFGDWIGVFVWPDHPKDQADFAQLISGKYTFLPYGKSEMLKLLNSFHMLTEDQKNVIRPELWKQALEAADGNKVKAQVLMAPFMERSVVDAKGEVDFNTTLGYIDWALVGAWPATQLYKFGRTVNTVGRIARLQGKETAAKVSNKALGDPTNAMAEALSIPKTTLFANGHPVNQSRIIFDSTDDLSGEMGKQAAKLDNERARLRDTLSEIEESEWIHVRVLDEDEMVSYANSKAKTLEQWAEGYYRDKGFIVERAEVFNQTDDGFQVRIFMQGMGGTDETIETPILSYTLDGIRKPTTKVKANPITTYLASPKVWLDAALKEGLLPEATVINFQQMRLQSIFDKAVKEVYKGIGKDSRKKLDAVLWQGSEEVTEIAGRSTTKGRVYKWSELEKGVDVKGELVRLTDAEKIAYYKARDLFDANYIMLGKMQREVLKTEGFMEAAIAGSTRILKPYMTREEVPAGMRGVSWNPITGSELRLTSTKQVDDMYADGWILADLHDSSFIPGTINGKKSQFSKVWVKPGNLKELRANPIKYVEGYVPRIYKGSPYVVTKTVKESVDGKPRESSQVVRLFEKRKDAIAYAKAQTAKSKNGSVYSPRHQDEVDMRTKRELILQEAGGLFIDPKGKHLKIGLGEGKLAPTYNATEALARQLGYLAKNMPANLWRQSVIQRWEDAARVAAGNNKGLLAEIADKGFWFNTEHIGDRAAREALDSSRRWIRDQLMMATPQETAWQATMWRLAEVMENRNWLDFAHKGVMWAGSKDPFSALRGAAFHALLGFWNPAQLIIQAQGFAIAASLDGLNPVQVTRRMRQYMAMRALGDNRVVNPEVMKQAAWAGGYKVDELAAIHDDFRKSGLLASVRTNADLEMMKHGFPVDKSGWRKVLDTNLFLYREGEMFTRGYSFLVARERYLTKHGLPTNTKLNQRQLQEVVESTTDKMLNLNRANRAQWQKGALSIPTQFFQVTTKFLEDFFPKFGVSKFDSTQRNKVLAMQFLLYGSASVPFGGALVGNLLDAAGVKPGDMPEELSAQLTDGVAGFLSELFFGESVQIGKRGAYLSGLEQMAMDIMSEQVDMGEIAAGASGHVLSRAWGVLSALKPMVVNPDVQLNSTEVEIAVGELAKVFSTFSNGHKALLWWRWQKVVNDRAQVVLTAEETDNFFSIVLFKALGFSSSTIDDVYNADNYARNWTKYKAETKQAMKEISADYLWRWDRGAIGEAEYRNMEAKWNALLAPYPEHIQRELAREVFTEVRNGDSKADKAWTKAFHTFLESERTQVGVFGIGMNRNIVKEAE